MFRLKSFLFGVAAALVSLSPSASAQIISAVSGNGQLVCPTCAGSTAAFQPMVVVVKDASGKVKHWNLELESPTVLVRNGWTRKSLAVGDEVTADGSQAKDGSNMANARVVTLASGKKVFAGSSGGDAAPASRN